MMSVHIPLKPPPITFMDKVLQVMVNRYNCRFALLAIKPPMTQWIDRTITEMTNIQLLELTGAALAMRDDEVE